MFLKNNWVICSSKQSWNERCIRLWKRRGLSRWPMGFTTLAFSHSAGHFPQPPKPLLLLAGRLWNLRTVSQRSCFLTSLFWRWWSRASGPLHLFFLTGMSSPDIGAAYSLTLSPCSDAPLSVALFLTTLYKIAIHPFISPCPALVFSRARAVYSKTCFVFIILCLPLLDFQLHENQGFASLVYSCIPCT